MDVDIDDTQSAGEGIIWVFIGRSCIRRTLPEVANISLVGHITFLRRLETHFSYEFNVYAGKGNVVEHAVTEFKNNIRLRYRRDPRDAQCQLKYWPTVQ